MLFVIIFLFSSYIGADGVQDSIRSIFHESELTEDRLGDIINTPFANEDLVASAYVGLCETMMAEYAFWPGSKLDYFNRGKERIELAIKTDPRNVELRYVRLLVQINAPGMLGYNEAIDEDVGLFVQEAANQIGYQWTQQFAHNLLEGKHLSEQQVSQLNLLITNFN